MSVMQKLLTSLMLVFGIQMAIAKDDKSTIPPTKTDIEIKIPNPDIPEPKDPTEG